MEYAGRARRQQRFRAGAAVGCIQFEGCKLSPRHRRMVISAIESSGSGIR